MPALTSGCFNLRVKLKQRFSLAPSTQAKRKLIPGFTLLEIVVATIILSLIILGMLSVFLAGSKHVMHTRNRITGAELGKLFIDPLQLGVNYSVWNSGALATGTTYCDSSGNPQNISCPPAAQRKINNRTFTATYVTTMLPDSTGGTDNDDNVRRVTTKIEWIESNL